MDDASPSWARELGYYRRECNDLGARLLRLQEEQSQAFREARRSRTVVKLLREAYRLGDLALTMNDVGGPMLELLVDNTLCDRAMLLREEPIGSGTFLVAQAIGLADTALHTPIPVAAPPAFLYTSGHGSPDASARDVVAGVGVPFVLWAYDRGSGHALVVGNRSESNVSRPFEPGDQELIEAALSVYLDVLYRKHAEAQLRQAKQAAEAASSARAAGLAALAAEMREPLHAIADLAERLRGADAPVGTFAMDTAALNGAAHPNPAGATIIAIGSAGQDAAGAGPQPGLLFGPDGAPVTAMNPALASPRDAADEIVKLSRYVAMLVDGAAEHPETAASPLSLDVEWVPIDELMRTALRSAYSSSVKLGIDIESSLPRRRTAVLADRMRIQHVVQHLVASVMRGTSTGGAVRISTTRRSDGGLEILVGARGAGPVSILYPPARPSLGTLDIASAELAGARDGVNLSFARAIAEAHGGTLTLEASPFGGLYARLVIPARNTRDIDLAEATL